LLINKFYKAMQLLLLYLEILIKREKACHIYSWKCYSCHLDSIM